MHIFEKNNKKYNPGKKCFLVSRHFFDVFSSPEHEYFGPIIKKSKHFRKKRYFSFFSKICMFRQFFWGYYIKISYWVEFSHIQQIVTFILKKKLKISLADLGISMILSQKKLFVPTVRRSAFRNLLLRIYFFWKFKIQSEKQVPAIVGHRGAAHHL